MPGSKAWDKHAGIDTPIYIHVQTHTYTYICTHVHVHICTPTFTHLFMFAHSCAHMQTHNLYMCSGLHHRKSHIHVHILTHKQTHSCTWENTHAHSYFVIPVKRSFVQSIWKSVKCRGTRAWGPERSWGIAVAFGGTLILHIWWFFQE